MKKKEIRIVCLRATVESIAPSKKFPCVKCGENVWVSDFTLGLAIKKANEKGFVPSEVIKPICLECSVDEVENYPRLSEEQKESLKEKYKKFIDPNPLREL